MARSCVVPDNLRKNYEFCRNIHKAHGHTYYLACKLLPARKRPHVHALYGLTRCADDIVDVLSDCPQTIRVSALRQVRSTLMTALNAGPTSPSYPTPRAQRAVSTPPSEASLFVIPAAVNTITTFSLDQDDFVAFFRSMEMDLTVTRYQTYDELLEYMAGSAAAIGSMMLPIVGTSDPTAAREPARQLGLAFQLTNFIRDVGEDLDRGRIYLPLEDLAAHGVTPAELGARQTTPPIRALIAYEIARAREHYTRAAAGIPLLHPRSQGCIRAAYQAYGGILDEVVRANYDVFRRRATVSTARKFAIVVSSLLTPEGRPIRRIPGGSR